ncbi:MAG: serpin family protein [Oscillospiraceae bacterium]|nr:serpin family protein [Oscillospiraceae bacterium]
MKRYIAFILLAALVLCLSACAAKVEASSATLLTPVASLEKPEPQALSSGFYAHQNKFAWQLFSSAIAEDKGKNVLISPLSVQLALCMTANGADGATLEQMQALLCQGELSSANGELASYLSQLPTDDKAKLHIANSIWYRGGQAPIKVYDDFLNICAGYYNAQAYQAPFNRQTVDDINGWVSQHTDGMIPTLVDDLDPSTAMVLLNALCFDAKWQSIFTVASVDDDFTAFSGQKQSAEYMFSNEYSFLELPNATGFTKNYASGGYKFAALLPNEGVDIYDFIASVSAEDLSAALAAPQSIQVRVWLPKFTCEYDLNMNELLCGLGMSDAFDAGMADFSKMSDAGLYISEVLHKTYIQVDENGTKASAATAIVMPECSAYGPQEFRTVKLDRPFVYMILDANDLPLFIGVVTELG